MASGGVDISKVKQTLTSYKERTETTECLKLTPFLKCIDACGLSAYKTNIEASIWPQLQDKTKKVAIDTIATVLFDNLAADVIGKKRKEKGRASVDDDEVKALSNDLRIKVAAKAGATVVKAPKVDATTTRLTDTSGYTGSHKERFAKDGKGKGLEGRKDVAENSGYVGNYKGAGTFDKKH